MQTIAPPGLYVWGNGLYPHATGGVMGSLAPSAYNTDMRSPYKRKKAPVVSSNPTGIIPRSRNEFAEHVIGHSEPPEVYNQGKPQLKQVIGPSPGRPPTVEDLLLDASEGKGIQPPKQMTLDDMIQLLKDSKNDDPEVVAFRDTLVAIKITSLSRTLTEFEQQYVDQARYELGKLAAEKTEETDNLALAPIAAKAEKVALDVSSMELTMARDELIRKKAYLQNELDTGRAVDLAKYIAATDSLKDAKGKIQPYNQARAALYKRQLDNRIELEREKIQEVQDDADVLAEQVREIDQKSMTLGMKIHSLSNRASQPKVPSTLFNRRSAAPPLSPPRSRRRSLSPVGGGGALVPVGIPVPAPSPPASPKAGKGPILADPDIMGKLDTLKHNRYNIHNSQKTRYSQDRFKKFALSLGIAEADLYGRDKVTGKLAITNPSIMEAIVGYPNLMNRKQEISDFINFHVDDFPLAHP